MTKEIYTIKSKETILTVANNKITAVQKSDTTKTGLRLYDQGKIGIAGAIGHYDENALLGKAKHMLNFNIPYAPLPTKEAKREEDLSKAFTLSEVDFFKTSEELLAKLSHAYPQFSFNHQITLEESEVSLSNDWGTNLVSKDKSVNASLFFKHKASKNLMDGFGAAWGRGYDLEDTFNVVSQPCGCYDEKVTLPTTNTDEKIPVIFLYDSQLPLMKFMTDLNGHAFGAGASLFSNKIDEKLFGDNFTLKTSRNTKEDYLPFFDSEGTILPGDTFHLIENGVLKSPYTSKRLANQYGFALTGCGVGDYDGIPDAAPRGLAIASSGKTIDQLLQGQKAIYVIISSGGDFTPQGEFAAPIQSAFLYENGTLLGRLPQLSMRSNVFDMFGKDFIGLATNGNSIHNTLKYLALQMEVSVIGDWI